MAEKITAYKASDGKLFKTEQEAKEHEEMGMWANHVRDFFASGMSPYSEGTYASMTVKIIMAWERYKMSEQNTTKFKKDASTIRI